MSTRDESTGEERPRAGWRGLPADGRSQPGVWEAITAAVLVPPERVELVRAALSFVDRLQFVADLDELLEADADLMVVHFAVLAALSDERLREVVRRCRLRPKPVRVVIDAPTQARTALQIGACVDLAAEPGIEPPELLARLWALLRRARLERDRNPLTGLPGNRWLRRQITETLHEGGEIGLLLLDIDDFKQYNDAYGHRRGDAAIELLAQVVAGAADAEAGVFAAHIGGDDFCIVCPPEALDDLAAACLATFAEQSRSVEDGAALTITVAGTIVRPAEVDSLEEAFARLARLKTEGKARPGSSYARD